MKSLFKIFFLPVMSLAVSVGTLLAQPFSFDENGNGIDYLYYSPTSPWTQPLSFTMGSDPSFGIRGVPVLMYSLPQLVTAGDVALTEPGQSSVSELIRFYNGPAANHTVIIFYSAIDGPDQSVADVGIPFSANPFLISETPTGANGNNGATWSPTNPNQPGYYSGPKPTFSFYSYFIITNVPEPGPAALMFSGAGIWWIRRHRARKYNR